MAVVPRLPGQGIRRTIAFDAARKPDGKCRKCVRELRAPWAGRGTDGPWRRKDEKEDTAAGLARPGPDHP